MLIKTLLGCKVHGHNWHRYCMPYVDVEVKLALIALFFKIINATYPLSEQKK